MYLHGYEYITVVSDVCFFVQSGPQPAINGIIAPRSRFKTPGKPIYKDGL